MAGAAVPAEGRTDAVPGSGFWAGDVLPVAVAGATSPVGRLAAVSSRCGAVLFGRGTSALRGNVSVGGGAALGFSTGCAALVAGALTGLAKGVSSGFEGGVAGVTNITMG